MSPLRCARRGLRRRPKGSSSPTHYPGRVVEPGAHGVTRVSKNVTEASRNWPRAAPRALTSSAVRLHVAFAALAAEAETRRGRKRCQYLNFLWRFFAAPAGLAVACRLAGPVPRSCCCRPPGRGRRCSLSLPLSSPPVLAPGVGSGRARLCVAPTPAVLGTRPRRLPRLWVGLRACGRSALQTVLASAAAPLPRLSRPPLPPPLPTSLAALLGPAAAWLGGRFTPACSSPHRLSAAGRG